MPRAQPLDRVPVPPPTLQATNDARNRKGSMPTPYAVTLPAPSSHTYLFCFRPRPRPHPTPTHPQATNDARNRKGSVSTFLRGTGRQSERVLSAQQDIGLLFKQMVEDVERNQATQVGGGLRRVG